MPDDPASPPAPTPEPAPSEKPPAEAPVRVEFLQRILELPLTLTVVLSEKTLRVEDVVGIKQGDVIEFDRAVNTPLTVEVHGQAIARGNAVKLGEKFGLKLTAIVPPEQAVQAMGGRPA